MKSGISAHDVAKLADVSQSTVSRVLNDYPYVKKETRNNVLKAIKKLGFIPDEIARSLVNKKTNTIGLVVENISNPFYSETAHIILREARKYDYEVVIIDAADDSEDFDKVMSTLIGKRVDGIIVGSVRKDNKKIIKYTEINIPIVFYNRKTDYHKQSNYIEIDNKYGAKMGVNHLVNLKHERIAYISGPLIYSTFFNRYEGYCEALAEHKIQYDENIVLQGKINYEKILNFSINLMKAKKAPSAFFASTDQSALAVLDAASRCGKHVPQDVSLIGFDNIDIAMNPFISLTTISQDKERMASIALKKLIKLINSDELDNFEQRTLLPKLIKRKTTGPNI